MPDVRNGVNWNRPDAESDLPTTLEQGQTEHVGFTQGPWSADEEEATVIGANGEVIAYHVIHGSPRDAANLRLIAGAPNLLAERDHWRSLFKQDHKHSYETITELGKISDIQNMVIESLAERLWSNSPALKTLMLDIAKDEALRDWEKAHDAS